jgi:Flp pilus assembly protein TadG
MLVKRLSTDDHRSHKSWAILRTFVGGKDGSKGVAAVEFAFLAPLLVVMIIAMFDLASGVFRKMQVEAAAQAGAQYAIAHGFNSSAITNAVTNATNFSSIAASPAPIEYSGCPTNTGVQSIVCNLTCSDGSTPGTYVSVSSLYTYITMFPYPMIPNQFVLASQATVRIQ